jgi:hypothetical protein
MLLILVQSPMASPYATQQQQMAALVAHQQVKGLWLPLPVLQVTKGLHISKGNSA